MLKGNLESIAAEDPLNEHADLYLEWHAIDGSVSGSGLGENIGIDEDGDGTDFDRIWGMESITVSYMNPGCYDYPIFGDISAVTDLNPDECISSIGDGTEGYIWDDSLEPWGNFLTSNAANYQGCLEQGNVESICFEQFGQDDSDHDFNGVDGRLVMEYLPTCIPDINVRHMMLEFLTVGEENPCFESLLGDLNNDGGYNVLDIVSLANCILSGTCITGGYECSADLNGDGGFNVLDIVTLANCVLSGTCSEL